MPSMAGSAGPARTRPCLAPTRCGRLESTGPLTARPPVTLTYDNGKGLVFTRTIAVDDKYMFTVDDAVANSGAEPVTLYPYGLVSRHEHAVTCQATTFCMRA